VGIVCIERSYRQTDRQTDRQIDKQTDRHDKANIRFSQLHERAQQETNLRDPGIRTAIPVVEQLRTYALDRTPTGIGY
jgi:hypothetical protein